MQRAYSFAKRPPGQAAAALRTGKALYAAGDRMGALKAFEAALAKLEPTATVSDVRMELLYSAACCHAAFGDIEMAWMNLRGAHAPSPHTPARNPMQPLASSTSWALARLADSLEMGLDYDTVQSGSNPEFMRMEVSAQMRKQLQKFSEGKIKSSGTVAREAFEKSRAQARAEGGPPSGVLLPPHPPPPARPSSHAVRETRACSLTSGFARQRGDAPKDYGAKSFALKDVEVGVDDSFGGARPRGGRLAGAFGLQPDRSPAAPPNRRHHHPGA